MEKPLISVCIPVYNGEGFLETAINSVLGQSFTDFELIIVDNNSTDNTVNIVKKYNDHRINLYKNDSNIGLIPNWNRAIEFANGEYIKILPADDLIYPDCLKLQSDILKQDSDKRISMVAARKNIIDKKGKILLSRGYSKQEGHVNGFKAINKVIRTGGGNIIGEAGVVMFRKEILNETGPFNSDLFYVLDLDMWFKMLTIGNLYTLPGILGAFRISESSSSLKVLKTQRDDITRFIKKIYKKKQFKLKWYNYKMGLLNVMILTFVKNIIYKIIL